MDDRLWQERDISAAPRPRANGRRYGRAVARARNQPPGIFHLTSRGVDRRRIYDGDETRLCFYRLLDRTLKKHGGRIHACCLMTNHYHVVYETTEVGQLSAALQYLNSTYARIYNEICGRRGYLFERPFHSEPVTTERPAISVCRYVVNNPVRAGMTARAGDYRWSSFRATAGLVSKPPFLTTSWVLGLFDANEDRARVKYAAYVAEGGRLTRKDMADGDMSAVRSADMARADSGQQAPRSVSSAPRRSRASNQKPRSTQLS